MVDPLKVFWVLTNSTYLGTGSLLPILDYVVGGGLVVKVKEGGEEF